MTARMTSSSLTFRRLFAILFFLLLALFATSVLYAWTNPTPTIASGNIAAPITIASTDQVKNGGLSVNAFTSFGNDYIQNRLGIGVAKPIVALDVAGAVRLGDGGEQCGSALAGALRYSTTLGAIQFCNGSTWLTITTSTL